MRSISLLSMLCFLLLQCASYGQFSHDTTSFINHDKTIQTELNPEFFRFKPIDSLINLNPGSNYNRIRKTIESQRLRLSKKYKENRDSIEKKHILDSALRYFTHQLINHIIPYWYGTKWEFNGYTATPGKGVVACGYFVSTTLQHTGLNLNRYKLAQAGPADEASFLSIKPHNTDSLIYARTGDKRNVLDIFNRVPEGLYFVGLDFHVGYLLKKNNSLLFIHSNYIDGKVMTEHAYESAAFQSRQYYLTKISENYELAKAWLLKTELNPN